MGPEASREAIRLLRPRVAVPSHYGTWPPIEQDASAWAAAVAADGVAEPQVLEPGGSFSLG